MSTGLILSLLATRPSRVVRPRDIREAGSNPAAELARLHDRGLVRRLVHGYYAAVPPEWMGVPSWRPAIEAVALGIAVADYGPDEVALMGPSAARLHGAWPRAIALGVVAAPHQRPRLSTPFGQVLFHKRSVADLDVERVDTALAGGYLTTVEQTILDLPRWSNWGVTPEAIEDAIRAMSGRADWEVLTRLAAQQRRRPALEHARALISRTPSPPEVGRALEAIRTGPC